MFQKKLVRVKKTIKKIKKQAESTID